MTQWLQKSGKKIDKKTLEKRLSEIPRKKVFRSELHKGAIQWGEDERSLQNLNFTVKQASLITMDNYFAKLPDLNLILIE